MSTYPVMLKSIKFTLDKNAPAGDYALALKSFYCHYPYIGVPHDLTGDVNDDGVVNIADINVVIGIILTGKPVGLDVADVNRDGVVNIADINLIISIILKS